MNQYKTIGTLLAFIAVISVASAGVLYVRGHASQSSTDAAASNTTQPGAGTSALQGSTATQNQPEGQMQPQTPSVLSGSQIASQQSTNVANNVSPAGVGGYSTAAQLSGANSTTTPLVVTVIAQQHPTVVAGIENSIAPGTPQTTLQDNTVAANWALQLWTDNTGGGEALLKYDPAKKQYVLVSWGGGAWSVDGLVEEGVPAATAATLLKNLNI